MMASCSQEFSRAPEPQDPDAAILLFTDFIGLGHFSHVIAGSGEAWLLVLNGKASLGWAVFEYILPACIGNVLGGTALFGLLAHEQIRRELPGS